MKQNVEKLSQNVWEESVMELIFPAKEHKQAALEYSREHFDNGEAEIHGDGGLENAESYEKWLEKLTKDLTNDLVSGYVPSTTYFAMVSGKIVGTIQIRHMLTDFLLLRGGHIGYSVRPTERRKGYAVKMLALALGKCREMNIENVLITCDKANIGSAKTIQYNGGVLENEVTEKNGNIFQRYWIQLNP